MTGEKKSTQEIKKIIASLRNLHKQGILSDQELKEKEEPLQQELITLGDIVIAADGSNALAENAQQLNDTTVNGDVLASGAVLIKIQQSEDPAERQRLAYQLYLRHLNRECQGLALTRLGLSSTKAADTSLNDVYIDLDLTQDQIVLSPDFVRELNHVLAGINNLTWTDFKEAFLYVAEQMYDDSGGVIVSKRSHTPDFIKNDRFNSLKVTSINFFIVLLNSCVEDLSKGLSLLTNPINISNLTRFLDSDRFIFSNQYPSSTTIRSNGIQFKPRKALDAVKEEKHIVLLGDPGSGKSTFVKRLISLVCQSQLDLTELPKGFPADTFPYYIELRRIIYDLEKIKQVPDSIKFKNAALKLAKNYLLDEVERLGNSEVKPEIGNLISSYETRFFLVLDGLDEVPTESRQLIIGFVNALLEKWNLAQVIVTCRTRSFEEAKILPDFASFRLREFSPDQVHDFIYQWYTHQLSLKLLRSQEDANNRIDELYTQAMGENLREMAVNPMLLTTMTILHQDKTKLPDQQVVLYKDVIELLLHRWQEGKEEFQLSDALQRYFEPDYRHRLWEIMERLAYECHLSRDGKKMKSDLTFQRAVKLLQEDSALGDKVLAMEFLDYLDMRSGLLIGYGGTPGMPNTYGFPHRTFQEYLAGSYLFADRGASRLLAKHAAEGDNWNVAVQFGMEDQLYNRRGKNTLLDIAYTLCQDCGSNETAQRLVSWAGKIIQLLGVETVLQDTSLQGGEKFLTELKGRLIQVMGGILPPVERVEAGNVLATIGDPRFQKDLFCLPKDNMLGFIAIPKGKFWMGSDDGDDNEKPYHEFDIPYDYYMARYPVTVAQWSAYSLATNLPVVRELSLEGIQNHPIVKVSWKEALSYCDWLTKVLSEAEDTSLWMRDLLKHGWHFILPSEIEWEKAARGADGREFPYGNEFDPNKGNTVETQIGSTSPVGCFPFGKSPYDCEDMSGNIWEWTRSLWGKNRFTLYFSYPYDSTDGREKLKASGARVLRGGAFLGIKNNVRCAVRLGLDIDNRNINRGFRICLVPPNVIDN